MTTFEQIMRHKAVQDGVVFDVIAERHRQDNKFGIQDRPLHPATGFQWIYQGEYLSEANRMKQVNDYRNERGILGWDTILLEEVYEALAERDPLAQEAELLQVAAVAVAAVENSRRRRMEKAAQEAA